MPCSLGVIGLGRMAQAIVSPLLQRGDFKAGEVLGVVAHKRSIQRVTEQLPSGVRVVSVDDPISADVWNAPIQLLAIKPQQFFAFEGIDRQGKPSKANSPPLLISVLAGIKLERLERAFPEHVCVRAVPNTPAMVGVGLTGLAGTQSLLNDQKLAVKKIFQPISEVFELPEDQLDAFLALTSSGPAYIALIAEALADGAVASGLPRLLANYLAHRTFYGTSLLLKEKDLHPGQLKDMVASPSGTTITALRHLEKVGVRSALMEAVILAAERSRDLA